MLKTNGVIALMLVVYGLDNHIGSHIEIYMYIHIYIYIYIYLVIEKLEEDIFVILLFLLTCLQFLSQSLY